MKLNKKGFTLIELLAVIVVLGIILAIAIPKVVDTIENSKKGSFDTSVKTFIKEAQQYVTKSEINGNPVTSGSIADLDMKNKNGWVGYWETDSNGKVYFIGIANNDYVAYNASSNNVSSQKLSEPFITLADGVDGIAIGIWEGDEARGVIISGTYSGSNKNIIIPNNVETLDPEVFLNSDVENIILPTTLKTIDNQVMVGNETTIIIMIPSGVNTISNGAFLSSNLTTIINKSGNKDWKNILEATNCTPTDGGIPTNFNTGYCICETRTVTITD